MPAQNIYALAKKTGKSKKEVEKLWNKAVKITSEMFGVSENNFSDKEYKYTMGVLKNMLGVKEDMNKNIQDFLDSNETVEKFIEQIVSGDLPPVEKIAVKKKKKDDEEDYLDEYQDNPELQLKKKDHETNTLDPGFVMEQETTMNSNKDNKLHLDPKYVVGVENVVDPGLVTEKKKKNKDFSIEDLDNILDSI